MFKIALEEESQSLFGYCIIKRQRRRHRGRKPGEITVWEGRHTASSQEQRRGSEGHVPSMEYLTSVPKCQNGKGQPRDRNQTEGSVPNPPFSSLLENCHLSHALFLSRSVRDPLTLTY